MTWSRPGYASPQTSTTAMGIRANHHHRHEGLGARRVPSTTGAKPNCDGVPNQRIPQSPSGGLHRSLKRGVRNYTACVSSRATDEVWSWFDVGIGAALWARSKQGITGGGSRNEQRLSVDAFEAIANNAVRSRSPGRDTTFARVDDIAKMSGGPIVKRVNAVIRGGSMTRAGRRIWQPRKLGQLVTIVTGWPWPAPQSSSPRVVPTWRARKDRLSCGHSEVVGALLGTGIDGG